MESLLAFAKPATVGLAVRPFVAPTTTVELVHALFTVASSVTATTRAGPRAEASVAVANFTIRVSARAAGALSG